MQKLFLTRSNRLLQASFSHIPPQKQKESPLGKEPANAREIKNTKIS